MSGLCARAYASIPTALIAVGFGVLSPNSAQAAEFALPTGIADLVPAQFQQIETAISALWDLALIAAALTFLFFLLIGGFQYLNSLGDEEGVKKSRQILMNAAVGLIIIVLAWPVGNAILNYFDLRVGNTNFRIPTLSPSNPNTNLSPASSNTQQGTTSTKILVPSVANGSVTVVGADDDAPIPTPISVPLDSSGAAEIPLRPGNYLFSSGGIIFGGCTVIEQLVLLTCDGSTGPKRDVTLSFTDQATSQPISGLLVQINKRGIIGQEELGQHISGTDGRAIVSLPQGVEIHILNARTGAELYSNTVSSTDGDTWNIPVAQ